MKVNPAILTAMVQNGIKLSKCKDYNFDTSKEFSPVLWAIAILAPLIMILFYMLK